MYELKPTVDEKKNNNMHIKLPAGWFIANKTNFQDPIYRIKSRVISDKTFDNETKLDI